MSLAEQMKGYENALRQQITALGEPVTEIALFRLLADATPTALESIQRDFVDNSAAGDGVRCVAWGPSLDDPRVVILMWDWRRIEDHWAFWQTARFPPVMACIERWFEPGRPLVRHYRFDPPGMPRRPYVRVLLWDHGEAATAAEITRKVAGAGTGASERKAAFAVDPGELTWCTVLSGYEDEAQARADELEAAHVQEAHLVKLEFVVPS